MQKWIDTVIKGLQELIKKDMSKHVGETAYSACGIQAGYHDFLKIVCKDQKIDYFIYDFDWSNTSDHQVRIELMEDVSKEDIATQVIPRLKEKIKEVFLDSIHAPMFDYCLHGQIQWNSAGCALTETYEIEDAGRKEELRRQMNQYIEEVIFQQKRSVKDTREMSVFCGQVLDFQLMGYSPLRAIEVIDQYRQTMELIQNRKYKREFEGSILHQLNEWSRKKFLPLYCEVTGDKYTKEYPLKPDFDQKKVDQEKLHLFVYGALTRIKHGSYSFDPSFGRKDLERAAKEFGSAEAKQYLTKGTGAFSDVDIIFKNADVECKANDVFSTIKVNIKRESAESYDKTLVFIIGLLQKGFPHSYKIALTSKAEKQFLPIKGLAKSQTHRFFAQALSYDCLHDKVQEYAYAAMEEFAWYADVEEGEKSCMPGSYAVFGLGLRSEEHFPLVEKYFELLDDEHQSIHQYFIHALIDRFGVTSLSLPLIIKGILSAQVEVVFKNLANLIHQENVGLLANQLAHLNSHEVENVLYAIWGKPYKKSARKFSELSEFVGVS